MEVLDRHRQAGKIRYIGISNFPADALRKAGRAGRVSVVEVAYNLIDRSAERELLPCTQRQMAISAISYGSLAQGLLSGTYCGDSRFDGQDRRNRLPHFQGEIFRDNLVAVERLKQVAAHYQKTPCQTALRWVLENPAIACALVGAKNPLQVKENTGALGWRLATEHYDWVAQEREARASV
jgi:aryl-alcohol dehydrogenase-like predicted oxidoreductase